MMGEVITSRSNQLVKHLRKLGASRDYRRVSQQFLCDGPKLLEEAHRSGMEICDVLLDELACDQVLGRFPWLDGLAVRVAAQGIVASASPVETPQGVLFSCRMRSPARLRRGKLVLLDRLQDTGNLGTILRCADAFGIGGVILDGCADPYNPKTVRAAMGALFRVPFVSEPLAQVIVQLREKGIPVYAAMPGGDTASVTELDLSRAAVVIGNEGAGVREEIAALCTGRVLIPMAGKAESLNAAVAGGILMWEMVRGR